MLNKYEALRGVDYRQGGALRANLADIRNAVNIGWRAGVLTPAVPLTPYPNTLTQFNL